MLRRLVLAAAVLGTVWAGPAHAATWCGTAAPADRTPELVGGDPVHGVYAIPSDGTDRLATVANTMETDAETIGAWWLTQDPTRAPRFDLFPFACGPQLDIASVRLSEPGAQLADAVTAFDTIAAELQPFGFLSDSVKSIVYYDGPVADLGICGIGGGSLTGSGLAIVFVNACAGVPTEWTAAHEFGHSLGAVPDGAPHLCMSGHVCDSTNDLMYPFAFEGRPLSSAVLDVNHDDYYAHSGPQPDIQDSPWLRHADAQVHLALTIVGSGSVASDVPGVACTATCGTDWDAGAQATLTPSAASGQRFVRWTGGCAGASTCPLTLAASTNVTALFAPATLRLAVSVTGKGAIVSRPAGIACRPRCSHAFVSFAPVRLTAKAAKGWKLKAWSGACRGRRLTCSVPMSRAASTRAVFVKKPKP